MIDPYNFNHGSSKKKKKAKDELSSSKSCTPRAVSSSHPTQPADSSSLMSHAISTASSSTATAAPGRANSIRRLEHRLPELEYFKQNNALFPDLTPRTTDFFSLGRRKSSTKKPSDGTSSGMATSTGQQTPRAKASRLPVSFHEPEGLELEPLPVRLGLAPPTRSHAAATNDYKTRIGHGYYFYLAPPNTSKTAAGFKSEIHRNTATSEWSVGPSKQGSSHSSFIGGPNTPLTGAASSVGTNSPGVVPDSPSSMLSDWQQGSSTDTAYSSRSFFSSGGRSKANSSAALPLGAASSAHSASKALPVVNLPPATPQCWDPDSYFITTKLRCRGKVREFKHHAFARSTVPYWCGYSQDSLMADLDAHMASLVSLKGHTLTPLAEDSRPARVLDLGCGQGAWCLDVARDWKQTEFVGLDVCPIQTPVSNLNDPDLERRVSWVVANFLEPLPIPDNSFDYVHMRFLQQAIPEDGWGEVVSEVERVLAPGGMLEIIESNYIFYGYANLVDAEELHDLESGKAATKGDPARLKMPKTLKVVRDSMNGPGFDPIQIVIERMMNRRFINPNPLSVIPSSLLTQGLTNVEHGNPRHIPIYADSARQRALSRARRSNSSSAITTSSDDDEKWKGKFTNRSQIGKPLNSSFHVQDIDMFRALGIAHACQRFSAAREQIWIEAEEEKRQVLKIRSAGTKAKNQYLQSHGRGHPLSAQPYAHPWKSKEEFIKAMDDWFEQTMARCDFDGLVDRYLGWDNGNEQLTVEGRKHAERQKKMSTAGPFSGDGPLQEEAEEEKEQPADPAEKTKEEIKTLGRGSPLGFSIATSAPSQEAPGRLQTTLSALENDGAFKGKEAQAGEKKRKPSSRPRSNGGVAMGMSMPGPFSRFRANGRGGIGGVPLPDSPAFMGSFAFSNNTPMDPTNIFRGPAQKAKMEPVRKHKPNSVSDSSSISIGKTARTLKDKSGSSRKESLSLNEEERRAKTHPVHGPPTTAPPQSALPKTPAAEYADSTRSASMPAKVKIVKPQGAKTPTDKPKEKKARSPVPLLGFYDVTGYVATAV